MRPTAFDVLLYMFEHYEELPDDAPPSAGADALLASEILEDTPLAPDPLERALVSEGFGEKEIHHAFQWLDELADQVDPVGDQSRGYELTVGANSIRVLSPEERNLLSAECVDFLMYLQGADIISAAQRELILDRTLALSVADMSLEQFQWLILMVLANQPAEEDACVWLEELLFDQATGLPN